MQARLRAYQEITCDYLNYLRQQKHKKLESKEETEQPPPKNEKASSPAPLSKWRDALTGVSYNGEHARFIGWDILAGHVKNNFFFKIFKKAEHANFIALIDRICKLDPNPENILNQIIQSETEEKLFNGLFDYFISLQDRITEKDDAYYNNMKALKRDIHHLANEWNEYELADICSNDGLVLRTLSSEIPLPDQKTVEALQIKSNAAYLCRGADLFYINKDKNEYTKIELDSGKSQRFHSEMKSSEAAVTLTKEQLKKIILITGHSPCSIQKRIIKDCSGSSHYQYKFNSRLNIKEETRKNDNRQTKTRWKRFTKIAASGMAITEIFMALAGLAAIAIVAPLGILIVLKVIVSISALFFGYVFAKDDLFALGKQISLGRIFQVKNPLTGKYEPLKGYQKAAIIILSPFSLVAGCCIASLAFTSVLAATGATYALPLLGAVSMIPLISAVSAFVFFLATAAFFLTIKEIISHVTKEKLIEYASSLKWQDNESGVCYGLRLFLEVGKWAVALLVMSMVAYGGYYLFKDKSVNVLEKIWSTLSVIKAEHIASVISFLYSAIKLVFGTKKIMQLLQFGAEKMKQAFSSKNDELQSKLNPIQQQALSSQTSYTATGMVLLLARTVASGGFYYKAAGDHHFSCPSVTAGTASGYIYSINAGPFVDSQKRQAVTPLSNHGLRHR